MEIRKEKREGLLHIKAYRNWNSN